MPAYHTHHSTSSMSTFPLFKFAEELVLEVTTHLSTADLAVFVRSSKACRRIAHEILYSLRDEEVLRVLKWARSRGRAQTMLHIFRHNPNFLKKYPGEGFTSLFSACKNGDTSLAQALLDTGVLPKPPTFDDSFAILCWGKPDRLPIARVLVAHGFDVNQIDRDGNTFLHCAYQRRTSTAAFFFNVQLLLDLGLDVNRRNHKGETLLNLVVKSDLPSLVTLLLSRVADVNAGSPPPLLSSLGSVEDPHRTVECLLEAGATITEELGLKLLEYALMKPWLRSLALFLDAWKFQLSTLHCHDPNVLFCAAAAIGDISMLQQLLQLDGVDGDCKVEDKTALMAAAEAGQEVAVEFLIPHVTNFDAESRERRTALHMAVRHGTEQTVRLLLPHTTCVIKPDDHPPSLLHDAIEYGSTATVSLLLQRMSSPTEDPDSLPTPSNWPVNSGSVPPTVLETAVNSGNLEAVRLLLRQEYWLKLERQNPNLLHHAVETRNEDIVSELIQWGTTLDNKDNQGFTPLMKAAELDCSGIVRALIDKGVDFEVMTPRGESAMTIAVEENHPRVVSCLLAVGANFNVQRHIRHGEDEYIARCRASIFRCAVEMGYAEIVRLLLPLVDENELYPLYPRGRSSILSRAVRKGTSSVVRVMLENGRIDLAFKDASGRTASDYAKSSDCRLHKDLIEQLSF
ncbi:ankyrin repeat-containing domain protein [Aspergillus aurantiobrunneus]